MTNKEGSALKTFSLAAIPTPVSYTHLNAHMTNYLSWLMNIRVNFAFLFYLDLIVLKMPILFI